VNFEGRRVRRKTAYFDKIAQVAERRKIKEVKS
jgi:hypothetical protein